MKMKALPTLAALLVLAAVLSQAQESLGSPQGTSCCLAFVSKAIPRSLLISYEYTAPECSNPGVVFTTKRGSRICYDPSSQWTQDLIRYLDQTASPSS